MLLQYLPAVHAVGALEPAGQNVPIPHGEAVDVPPVQIEPAVHATEAVRLGPEHSLPTSHAVGYAMPVAGQYEPVGLVHMQETGGT